jgi:hypothetical protein
MTSKLLEVEAGTVLLSGEGCKGAPDAGTRPVIRAEFGF